MIDKKYNKILTVILIIVGAVIVGLLVFWGVQTYQRYVQNREINEALDEFDNAVNSTVIRSNSTINSSTTNTSTTNEGFSFNLNDITEANSASGSSSSKTVTYKGFTVVGTIEIPAIDLEYPVLERATKASLETSIAVLIGPGLNEVGNTVIVGHNYRNGTFFSRNSELVEGDEIYITDTSGNRIKYIIYNIYTTSSDDADYITRDTAGAREISLSTCTDDSKYRLIIWAKEE